MSECKHPPTGQNRRRFAFPCAQGRCVFSVPMEVRGALEKGGKNQVLHLEKLQFKCISTKGGCVLAYGALETSEGRAGLGTWGSPTESQQQGGEIRSPGRGVRLMFTDFDLAFEKTLWDFSFICLAQGSFTSVVYAAPFWGAKVISSHFQDGRSGCTRSYFSLQRAVKERAGSRHKGAGIAK